MILGIDHLTIAVEDPDAAISELAASLGLASGISGGRHLSWGTRNRLLWLGDSFIELCTVFDPRLAERSWLGRATLRGLAGGPTPICWAIATDDIDLERASMNAEGASLDTAVEAERRRPDGGVVRWRSAVPGEVGLDRPFLIEHDLSAAEWTPEDRADRARGAARLVDLQLPVERIEGLGPAGTEIEVGGQTVRAVGAEGGPVRVRVDGLGLGGATADILGCRWVLD